MDPIENKAQEAQNIPSAPPAPAEVKVRTLKSDLASMAASGGGLPQFQNVKVERFTNTGSDKKSGGNLLVAIIVILALVVIAAVGYFGYQALEKNNAMQNTAQTLP